MVKHIQYNIEKYAVRPQNLKLEIAEHLIRDNPQTAMNLIPQLRKLDIGLQIDNFGRIAASYGYFQPNLLYQEFEKVKIDRYLTNRIDRDADSWSIYRNLVSSVGKSGLKTIAMGIETASQYQQLQSTECSYGQGNFFFRPLAGDAVARLIRQQQETAIEETK